MRAVNALGASVRGTRAGPRPSTQKDCMTAAKNEARRVRLYVRRFQYGGGKIGTTLTKRQASRVDYRNRGGAQSRGMSQREFAKKLKRSNNFVWRIEAGER